MLTQRIDDEKGNGPTELSVTLNSQIGPIKFILEIHHFNRPQQSTQMNNHPLRDTDYNTAFQGRKEDGSLAFRGQCT